MAKTVVINGVTYADVPEVDVPLSGSGTAKFMDTTDADAVAGDILSGKTAYVNSVKIEGSIASQAATTWYTSSSDQTIASGKYLSGNQTIKAVTTTNITAANIKSGVTVKVGDAADDDRVLSVTGSLALPSISQDGTTKILSIS